MTQTTTLTDPARELAELCTALQQQTNKTGEAFLAEHFGVDAWSREFFEIIFTIVERCEGVRTVLAELDIDRDFRDEIISHVNSVQAAFSAASMRGQWKDYGYNHVQPLHVQPLKAISSSVRQRVSYRKLSSDEIDDILLEASKLLEWLEAHQLEEPDFIRQALIEGLRRFLFRLKRLQWLGWGYTLESLKEVISAYMLLERREIDPNSSPHSAAAIQKVGGMLKYVYGKVSVAKEVVETGDWLLKAYGAASLFSHTTYPHIAGLLT